MRIWIGGDFREIDFQGAPQARGGIGLACFKEDWTPCVTDVGGADSWRGPFAIGDFKSIRDIAHYRSGDGSVEYLFVVGNFTTVGGVSKRGLVRLNALTGEVSEVGFNIGTGFAGSGGSDTFEVRTVEVDAVNQKIYAGGSFLQYNGQAVRHFVRLNWDGSLDTSFHDVSWRPFVGSSDAVASVFKIHLWDHDGVNTVGSPPKVYVAGSFDQIQSKGTAFDRAWSGVVRFHNDGTLDENFCPGGNIGVGPSCSFSNPHPTGFDVRDMFTRGDGKVVLAGRISEFGSNSDFPKGMLVLEPDGSLNTAWKLGSGRGFPTSSAVELLALANIDNDSWVFAGTTQFHGGDGAAHFAVWDKTTKNYVVPNPLSFSEPVDQLAYDPKDPDRFFAAGSFCYWSNGPSWRTDSHALCGLAPLRWADYSTDDSVFAGKRGIYFDPKRIAFLPENMSLGDASGDIVAIGDWTAYLYGNNGEALLDHNEGDPDVFYSRNIARLDGVTGHLDFNFDTGFEPFACPIETPNCPERDSTICLSHAAQFIAIDNVTGHTYLSGFNPAATNRTYRGTPFSQDTLVLAVNGDVVVP